MYPNLPPLNTLRAFEAAARNVSFTLAAKELFVTHGAVSKQVKILEQYLNVNLFIRQHRKLILTEEAKPYLIKVQNALQSINSATQELITHPQLAQRIAINVLPSLTISWLIPSLESFKLCNPNLFVDLSIGDFPVDFSQHQYDIAIRSGKTKPQHCNAIKLMDEDLCFVCSPQLALQMKSLQDINKMTLLEHTSRAGLWRCWADDVGITLTTDKKFGMEHFYMLSQAAVSSMGVALIPRFFVSQQLADGSLVVPFSASFVSSYSYYLLTPTASPLPLKVQTFVDWLLPLFAHYQE